MISSSTGQSGTTNFTKAGVAHGTSVNLQAPATDPAGYAFSQWTVNGAAQTLGQKSIAFTMDGAVTAVAQYTLSGYALTVESTPPTGLSIGSSTGQKGITNYYLNNGVGPGTSVNLVAPATDPAGYTFSQWTVNGATQPAGQKSITFAMSGDMTAVAEYTLNGYALTVQSTPPTGLSIASSTSDGGMTNYTKHGSAYGASVNLQAPATDPAGYTFSQWTLNGAAQSRRAEVHHVHDGRGGDGGGALHGEHRLHAFRAVHAADRAAHQFEHGRRRHDELHDARRRVRDEREPAGRRRRTRPDTPSRSGRVNGAAQADGQKSITFTMDGAVTAVAQYTANTSYALTVESTPPVKQIIGSSTGHGGTTSYTKSGVAYGTSVNLQAPAADPAGYTFSQWTVNGAAQPAGQKSVTFTMDAAVTAVAQYKPIGYTLTVESTPPTGLSIGSSTGQSGTTNYTKSGVAYGTSVNLEAPATDPAGYTFSQWTLNGAAQPDGQKSVTFTIDAAVTAVAKYTPNTGYTLTVQSTPPGKQVITSSTSDGGMTNYTVPGVAYGASVNLEAPATDPAGYTFSQWTVNGAAQVRGQKSVTFTMDGAVTAVAEYTANAGYTLTVQSTPPSRQVISSSTGQNGTTNYTKAGVGNGTSVNLASAGHGPGRDIPSRNGR